MITRTDPMIHKRIKSLREFCDYIAEKLYLCTVKQINARRYGSNKDL